MTKKNKFKKLIFLFSSLIAFTFLTINSDKVSFYLKSFFNGKNNTASVAFFIVFYINIVTLFIFAFLCFRFFVNYIVNARKGDFGLSLKTKLISSFVFFSVLPTIILLFITAKFVNINYEKWMPEALIQNYQTSLELENYYLFTIQELIQHSNYQAIQNLNGSFNIVGSKIIFNDKKPLNFNFQKIKSSIKDIKLDEVRFVPISKNSSVIIKKYKEGVTGVLVKNTLHSTWEFILSQSSGLGQEIQVMRFSYFIMLGVITCLILFSALWLAFTLAKDISIPIEMLAKAAEQISLGNYHVSINDVVSNYEMEKLAISFRAMVHDIRTSRAATEEVNKQLLHNLKYNEMLLKSVNTAVIVLHHDKSIHTWNYCADLIFNKSSDDVINKKLYDIVGTQIYEDFFLKLINKMVSYSLPKYNYEFNGLIENKFVQLHASVSKLEIVDFDHPLVVFFINDFTALAKAQRLAAWRDVARRLAHEIKNPLTPIRLSAQRIDKKYSNTLSGQDKKIFKDSISLIVQSVDSIRRLVDEFSKFARMPNASLKTGNLLDAIRVSVLSYLDNPEKVPVKFYYNGNIMDVSDINFEITTQFDKDQIVQSLTNLIKNGISASLKTRSPVSIKVEHHNKDSKCTIKVVDYGSGIDKDLREKIFEPYFSTKRAGTGLGLVIVQQVIREHQGELNLIENKPKGSIFEITLPVF